MRDEDYENYVARLECLELQILDEIKDIDINAKCNRRWLSIAKSHFQQGFMAALRSIREPLKD